MTGPADRDELRDRLILAIEDAPTIADAADLVDDHVLPLVRDEIAAAVAAERERIAQAIEATRRQDAELGGPAAASAAFREAARIAREEHTDG